MTEKRHSYVQHMNVLFDGLQRFDIQSLVDACTDQWYNQTLCQVNDSVVRLGILQGDYHWHKHDKEDEFFFTLSGELFIDVEDAKTVALGPHQGYVVPKGVEHKTRAPGKTVVLMVETSGIAPIGDS